MTTFLDYLTDSDPNNGGTVTIKQLFKTAQQCKRGFIIVDMHLNNDLMQLK